MVSGWPLPELSLGLSFLVRLSRETIGSEAPSRLDLQIHLGCSGPRCSASWLAMSALSYLCCMRGTFCTALSIPQSCLSVQPLPQALLSTGFSQLSSSGSRWHLPSP